MKFAKAEEPKQPVPVPVEYGIYKELKIKDSEGKTVRHVSYIDDQEVGFVGARRIDDSECKWDRKEGLITPFIPMEGFVVEARYAKINAQGMPGTKFVGYCVKTNDEKMLYKIL